MVFQVSSAGTRSCLMTMQGILFLFEHKELCYSWHAKLVFM